MVKLFELIDEKLNKYAWLILVAVVLLALAVV